LCIVLEKGHGAELERVTQKITLNITLIVYESDSEDFHCHRCLLFRVVFVSREDFEKEFYQGKPHTQKKEKRELFRTNNCLILLADKTTSVGVSPAFFSLREEGKIR